MLCPLRRKVLLDNCARGICVRCPEVRTTVLARNVLLWFITFAILLWVDFVFLALFSPTLISTFVWLFNSQVFRRGKYIDFSNFLILHIDHRKLSY